MSNVVEKNCFRSWFKGADTTASARYLEWKYFNILQTVPEGYPHRDYLESVRGALREANEFLSRLFKTQLFMRRPEAKHIAKHGRALLNKFTSAAQAAFLLKKRASSLRQKCTWCVTWFRS